MNEAELQRLVEAELDSQGVLWHHCADSRRCRGPKGFPDLVVLDRRGLLFAELKSEDERFSMAQLKWRKAITRAGLWYYEWRPEDWLAGEIQDVTRPLTEEADQGPGRTIIRQRTARPGDESGSAPCASPSLSGSPAR